MSVERKNEYRSAIEAYRRKEIATALAKLRVLYQKAPDYAQTRIYFGRALYYSRMYPEAAQVLEEACDYDPCGTDARFWLVKALLRNPGRAAEALEVLDGLLAEDPGHVKAWYLKANLHEQRQEIQEAIFAYQSATVEEKKAAIIHLRLGILSGVAGFERQSRREFLLARLLAGPDPALLTLIDEAERRGNDNA